MNVYNLKNIERCCVCGNIDRNLSRFIETITSNLSNFKKKEHKMEKERQERLKLKTSEGMDLFGRGRALSINKSAKMAFNPMDSEYNDTLIIVSGNCGIGTKSKQYYDDVFGELDKILAANNCYIMFVRGNNDNPSYFEDRLIDFEHIKTLPDYSVVALKNYNCLCIGGSVSIDKEWKLAQESLVGKKIYWENEAPIYDEKKLDEILSEFKIACVITSTAPTFVYPGTNSYRRSKWFSDDKSISKEFNKERKTIDKIYERIMDSETKPYTWFYGRFKMGHSDKVNDILFTSLAQFQMANFNTLLMAHFGINPLQTLGTNEHTFDAIIDDGGKKTMNSSMRFHAPEAFDEPINQHNDFVDHHALGEWLDEDIEELAEDDEPNGEVEERNVDARPLYTRLRDQLREELENNNWFTTAATTTATLTVDNTAMTTARYDGTN